MRDKGYISYTFLRASILWLLVFVALFGTGKYSYSDESPDRAVFPAWDINNDGIVDLTDLLIVAQHFGEAVTEPSDPNPDVNGDGKIDILDLILVGRHFGEKYDEFSVYVENPLTGEGVPDAEVKLSDESSKTVIVSGHTDNQGCVILELASNGPYFLSLKDGSTQTVIEEVVVSIESGQTLTYQVIPEMGNSRYGSTPEDLKRMTYNDGYHEDTILETWGRFPVSVNVQPYIYTHFGVDIPFDEVFWRVATDFEAEVNRRLPPDRQLKLFEPGVVDGYGIDVVFNNTITWVQFYEWDEAKSLSPTRATLHVRNYSAADINGVAHTENLEKELRNALVWLLVDGDGNKINWIDHARTFRMNSTDLSNVDLVSDITSADYDLVALACSLENGTDLATYKNQTNSYPYAVITEPGGDLKPDEPIALDASESFDPDRDKLSYRWEQVQGFHPGRIADHNVASTTVVVPHSGDYVFQITVGDGQGGVDSERVHLYALADCPEPQPIKTIDDMIVAAFYESSWGIAPQTEYGDLALSPTVPLLGNYSVDNPEVINWHIKMAVENGVNCFFPVALALPQQHDILGNFFSSKYVDNIKIGYGINNEAWMYSNVFGLSLTEATRQSIDYVAQNYFEHPSYLKIDEKPVVFYYHARILNDTLGHNALQDTVNIIRTVCEANGYENIYLIGDLIATDRNPENNRRLAELFDCISGFNMLYAGHGWDFHPTGTVYTIAPYESMVDGYQVENSFFRDFANNLRKNFIPTACVGYDNSDIFNMGVARHMVKRTHPTPELFRRMLLNAKELIGSPRMIFIESWNEWTESTALEPSISEGSAYLDVVKEIFLEQ